MKRTDVFRFKQFGVRHDTASHKVGTDGVLLGAWVRVPDAGFVLDVGTGSGVIALILAQRTNQNVTIEAIEIQAVDADLARENFVNSPWTGRLEVYYKPLQAFTSEHSFDLIVSNPPFFINSLSPPSESRGVARHAVDLTFEELITCSQRLLSPKGVLAIVLPATEAKIFSALAKARGLYPTRVLSVRTRKTKPVERILLELTREQTEVKHEQLTIHSEADNWSKEYRDLMKDFYLKL